MKLFAYLAAATVLAFAQAQPRAVFEAADIQPSPKVLNPGMRGPMVRGGRYELKDATILDMIRAAYDVQADQVKDGPTWLDSDRFDIIAKAPGGITSATSKPLLRALLEDRFTLAVHKDTRPLPAYSLTVGKGKPKLKQSAPSEAATGCDRKNDEGYAQMTCRNETMAAFVEFIRGVEVPGGLLTYPVVDSTGLQGAWDFDFKWSPRNQVALGNASQAIMLSDALDKQLGLKIEQKKIPLEVLVVDKVTQKPAANPPDTAAKLPPPIPAEFEIAEIRPSRPDAEERGNFSNGRLDVQGLPLGEIIKAVWNINKDDLIANLPKFAESAKYDIVAKVSTDPKIAAEVDDDTLMLMVRKLLQDRFHLATHMEDRQVSTLVLSSVKPRMLKANGTHRTECVEGPGADGKDPRVGNPTLNRLFSCYNMTMAQFAELLPNRVNGYVQSQVRDESGLTDAYDFTLSFSGVNIYNRLSANRGPGDAAEPSGALSLSDAISKQMGLKLDTQKRTAPVLVIDHLDEKPVDN